MRCFVEIVRRNCCGGDKKIMETSKKQRFIYFIGYFAE